MNWGYEGLFEAVHKLYEESLQMNISNTKALSRTISEFETTMNLGIFERCIIIISYGEIL